MSHETRLSAEALYQQCDPEQFSFETTETLSPLDEFIGQERAEEAMHFSVEMERDGYNLFVIGPPGSGRHRFVRQYLEKIAATKPTGNDWCYINNFDDAQKPRALKLPTGVACQLRRDMERLIWDLRSAIPAAFQSDDYRRRRQNLEEVFKDEQSEIFEKLQGQARERGISLIQTPTGIAFAPIIDEQVIGPEEFQKLPAEEQQRLQKEIEALGKELQEAMRSAPERMSRLRDQINELDRDVTILAAGGLIDAVAHGYNGHEQLSDHFRALKEDVVENVRLFLPHANQPEEDGGPPLISQKPEEDPAFRRYGVNVLVDNANTKGAPIIFHDNPTYPYLIGQVEHLAQMGTLITDFNLIKGGALHAANGGYLIIDARKILNQQFAWEGLKQALRGHRIKIESIAQSVGFAQTVSLEPEPIPLDVKVVVIGDAFLYHLLLSNDPDFVELFKVVAEFDDQVERTDQNCNLFAQLLGGISQHENLRHLTRDGVARIVEASARHAGDAERLSTRLRFFADIVREADYWAGRRESATISADDVQQAIDAKDRRSNRIRERMHEQILRETVLIDTDKAKVGQINGLAVMQVGDFAFGKPSRITARLRIGTGKVIDIEREVEMGGPLHSKGVMILSSYIGSNFAIDEPLSFSASLVFEQSYGGVDGDSASSTELYALLSALSEVPIKQSLAVTGSVNQYGEVQAIGGANEKIEGFYDICAARGLTGDQGVLIPASNVKHLMLRADIVDAVKENKFHIYSVSTIDQGIEILTGKTAGVRNEDGTFPAGTINELVRQRLISFAEKRRSFQSSEQA